jgi:hypothetical protein
LRIASADNATVHVRRPRMTRAGRVKLQITIRTDTPFNALDLDLVYDPSQFELVGATLRDSTGDAIISHGTNGSGVARVVVASGLPLGSNGHATLTLELAASRRDGALDGVQVFRAEIDEQPADIVIHRTRRGRTR